MSILCYFQNNTYYYYMPKTTNLLQEIMVAVQNHTKFPSLALFVTGLEQRS